MSSNSWVTNVRKTLWKYDLPSPYYLVEDPPIKRAWKNTTKAAVNKYWTEVLASKASNQISLRNANLESCKIGVTHPVWCTVSTDPRDVTRAALKAKILTGQYTLQSDKYARKQSRSPVCPICGEHREDLSHFILQCSALDMRRREYFHTIMDLLPTPAWNKLRNNDKLLLQLVVDCSSPSLPPEVHNNSHKIEPITRRMCYALHNQRSTIIQTDLLLQPPPLGPKPNTHALPRSRNNYVIAAEEGRDAKPAVRLS